MVIEERETGEEKLIYWPNKKKRIILKEIFLTGRGSSENDFF